MISVIFEKPGVVQAREETLPAPAAGQVLVQTLLSAISPGTEMLIYRGEFPPGLAVDASIASLAGGFHYPQRYGYALVGRIVESGAGIDHAWEGRLAFAFQPHASHFLAEPHNLIPLPSGISAEQALFLPNMETAVNFLMDGAPLIGEQVVVFGQGIVGLLTAALLQRFPLGRLVTIDRFAARRQASLALGVFASLEAQAGEGNESLFLINQLKDLLPGGADLAFEVSGAPSALDQAIAVTGFNGRVVIGSWYGQKRANLDLGGQFHRSHMRLISSQVSILAPELSGRWNKQRRFELAWEMLRLVRPERWITQRFPVQMAPAAYHLLDNHPEQTIQVVFTY